jgi:DNA-binding CsgD family transcriptional regulator
MRQVGIGDIAAVACRDASGCWGWIEAYRDSGDRPFEERDVDLLARIGPPLGSALRRTMFATASPVLMPIPPAVLVLDANLRLVSRTPGAHAWIEALPSARMFALFAMLPSVVYPAATLARDSLSADGAHALLRAVDGRWVTIEAAPLEGGAEEQIAVTLRAAKTDETFDVLYRAYALSRRERQVVKALLAGLDTRAITARLFISPHTVQDHLKSVFAKVGVHSRRELLATFNAAADDA